MRTSPKSILVDLEAPRDHVSWVTGICSSEGNKVTQYRVKAPATQVSCQDVDANTTGKWKVTIQACPKDGICSDSSKPISFKVVNR